MQDRSDEASDIFYFPELFSGLVKLIYPIRYAHGFVMICFAVVT